MKKGFLFSLIAMVLMSFSVSTFAGNEEEEAAIKKRLDEFTETWNKHDAKGIASFWMEDGDLINPIGKMAKGRTEIEKLVSEEHNGPLKNSKAEMAVQNIRFLDDDLALVDAEHNLENAKGPGGKVLKHQTFRVTAVLKKEDGKWFWVSARPVPVHPFGRKVAHDQHAGHH